MNTELGSLLDTYQKKITKLETEQMVQDVFIKAIMSTMPEEVKSHVHELVKRTWELQVRDESGEQLKAIAQDYLQRVFQVK